MVKGATDPCEPMTYSHQQKATHKLGFCLWKKFQNFFAVHLIIKDGSPKWKPPPKKKKTATVLPKRNGMICSWWWNPDTQKHIQVVGIGLAPKSSLRKMGNVLGPNPKITKICIANRCSKFLEMVFLKGLHLETLKTWFQFVHPWARLFELWQKTRGAGYFLLKSWVFYDRILISWLMN